MKTNSRYSTPETRAAAVAEYASGISSEVVAEMFGVSATSVVTWCRAAGVRIRKGGRRPEQEALAYTGGWVLQGGVMRPRNVLRKPHAELPFACHDATVWDNRGTTKDGPRPAA